MSNKFRLFIILFFISYQLQAQTQFLPIFKNGKWGAIDGQARIIIQPKYSYISNFDAQAQAVALLNGKVGIINQQDKTIIPFKYNNIQKITDELYAVLDEKWGAIDTDGKVVLPLKYDLLVLNNLFYNSYTEFTTTSTFFIQTQVEDKKGILTADLKVVAEPIFEDIYRVSESLWIGIHEDKQSIINIEGKQQSFDTLSFERWEEERLLTSRRDKLIGLIDATGREIVPTLFEKIEKTNYFNQPFWSVHKGTLRGLYDFSGGVVLAAEYNSFNTVGNNLFTMSTAQGWGLVRTNGEILLPCQYSKLEVVQNRYVFFTQNGLMGLYDIDMQENIFEAKYKNIEMVQVAGNVPFFRVIDTNNKKTLLNEHKKSVLTEENFDEMYYDPAGTFKIRKGNLWGISGELGSITPQFDHISKFIRNVALVEKNGKKGLINILGQIIVSPIHTKIELKGQTARIYQNNQEAIEYIDLDAYGRIEDRFQVNNLRKITVNKKQNTPEKEAPTEKFDFELDENLKFNTDNTRDVSFSNRFVAGVQVSSTITEIQDNGFTFYWEEEKRAWGIKDSKDTVLYAPQFSPIRFDTLANLYFFNERANRIDNKKEYIFNAQIGKMILENTAIDVNDVILDFRRGDLARLRKYYLKKDGTRINQLEYTLANGQTKKAPIFFAEPFTPTGYSRVNILGEYPPYLSNLEVNNIQATHIRNGRWGMVNTKGVLIAPNYEVIRPFDKYGFAQARLNHKWGILDTTGKERIKPEYDEVSYLPNAEGQYWLLKNKQKRAGFVDSTQRVSIALAYKEVRSFSNQRAAVQLENDIWNFIDTQGNLISEEVFAAVSDFQEGFAAVKQGRYWYYIDTKGNTLAKDDFTKAYNFSEGLAMVIKKGKYGYINTQGEEVIPCIYRKANDFKSGVAVVLDETNRTLFLDAQGNIIQKLSFEEVNPFNEVGLASYRPNKQKNNYGLISKEGKAITPANYQSIDSFREGFTLAKKGNVFVFIDTLGNQLKGGFLSAKGFSEGLAAVKTDAGWGYINTTGEIAIPANFAFAYSFYKGWAKVINKQNKVIWIDNKGTFYHELPENTRWRNIDITPKPSRGLSEKLQAALYGKVWQDENHSFFSIQGAEDKQFKFYNSQALLATNQLFTYIGDYKEGFIDVKIEHSYGLASIEGEILLPAEYDNLSYIDEGIFRVEQGGKIGYFHAQKKKWIWQLQK